MDAGKIVESLNAKNYREGTFSARTQNPDLTRAERKFLESFSPEKSLIIYGSLASGAPNYSVVEHIKGNWQKGTVRGSLEKKGWGADLGYFGFRQTTREIQQEIKVFVLFSGELNANWQMLDDFEGHGYRRILTEFELENGRAGVGYIYAVNEEEI